MLKICVFSSMVTLSLGYEEGRRHDLGTAIIYAGQRHNIEFYLNGRLIMQELVLQPLDSLHVAVTKYEASGVDGFTAIDLSSDDTSTLSLNDISRSSSGDVEKPASDVEEVTFADSNDERSSGLAVNGQPAIRCVPLDRLHSDDMVAYCNANEGVHYVSLLRDAQ